MDLSFSRGGRDWWARRYAEGYRIAVQCLWTGGYGSNGGIRAVAEANLRDARAAGFVTAGYLNSQPWYDAATSLSEARANAGAEWEHLAAVFNDVEIPGVTEAQVKAHCEAITAADKPTGIYSAAWFWQGHLGDPQWPWLRGYRVWEAYYDGDPDVDFASRRFGPWELDDVMGEQYRGTTDLDGVEVDLNVFDKDWFPEEDEMPTLDEIRTVIKQELDLTDQRLVELQVRLRRLTAPRFVKIPEGQPGHTGAVYLVSVQTQWFGRTQVIAQGVPDERTLEILGGSLHSVDYSPTGGLAGRKIVSVEPITAAELAKMTMRGNLPSLKGA